jgi:hypothetical protein
MAVVLVLVVALLLLTAWAVRRAAPDDELARVIAAWQAPPPAPGANAFEHLWLIEWDLPEAQRAAVFADDRERTIEQANATAAAPAGSVPAPEYVSSAEGRFPRWALEDQPQLQCVRAEDACLSGLSEIEPEAWQRLEQAGGLRERIEAVHGFGHLRADDALHFASFASAATQRSHTTRIALAIAARTFREQSPVQGLSLACREVATARRFAGHSAHLIARMIKSSLLRASLRLVGELLAEYPLQAPLPTECALLAQPPEPEVGSMCAVAGAENRWMRHALLLAVEQGSADVWSADLGDPSSPLFDVGLSVQWHARALAWSCDQGVLEQVRSDDPAAIARVSQWPADPPVLQCIVNPVGCTLARVAQPDYSRYVARGMDDLAVLRMGQLLIQLREAQARGEDSDVALARLARPILNQRRWKLTKSGTLELEMYEVSRQATIAWPVPGSRVAAAND